MVSSERGRGPGRPRRHPRRPGPGQERPQSRQTPQAPPPHHHPVSDPHDAVPSRALVLLHTSAEGRVRWGVYFIFQCRMRFFRSPFTSNARGDRLSASNVKVVRARGYGGLDRELAVAPVDVTPEAPADDSGCLLLHVGRSGLRLHESASLRPSYAAFQPSNVPFTRFAVDGAIFRALDILSLAHTLEDFLRVVFSPDCICEQQPRM